MIYGIELSLSYNKKSRHIVYPSNVYVNIILVVSFNSQQIGCATELFNGHWEL